MPSDFTAPSARDREDRFADDPDLAGLDSSDSEEASDLDELRAELNTVVVPTVTLKVEGRPGYAVTYRTNIEGKELDLLRKRAKDRKFSDGIDGVKFGALLLATTCVDVLRGGKSLGELLGVEGPVTFTSRPLQALMETASADETIRKFYGLEGGVDAAATRVLREAGWGDEAGDADPTE